MNGHIASETLSAYLDGETGPAETRRLAAHLDGCAACRSRLEATRRTVGALRLLGSAPVPSAVAAAVRGRLAPAATAAAAPAAAGRTSATDADAGSGFGGFGDRRPDALPLALRAAVRRASRALFRLRSWVWWQGLPPLRGSFSAARPLVGAALALLVAVLLVQNGEDGASLSGPLVPKLPHGTPEFLVSEVFGDAPPVLPQTTSEVAGRVFVFSDDVWVQRGLDDSDLREPRARVPAGSPRGRALLARYSDLGVLLADGSRVVLRDRQATLELWNGS